VIVVRAAAGTGKTTDLACRYLSFLARGVSAEQAIAITYTRRAAAELEERVALALRASLSGEAADEARARLGAAWPKYAAVAPKDPDVVKAALSSLPNAPIGTTDHFVLGLLTEMALDASLPVPGGQPIPLDVPLAAAPAIVGPLQRAARRVLDPPEGATTDAVDPDVALVARYLTLDQILSQIVMRTPWDNLPLARTADVLGTFVPAAARALWSIDPAALTKVADPASADAWCEALLPITNQAGRWAVPEIAAWLAGGAGPDEAPYAMMGWLVALHLGRKVGKAVKPVLQNALHDCGPAELSLWEIVQALRYPYDDPEQVRVADTVREARERLRQRVVARGLEEAARAGELGYDELLAAATALCEAPPARMGGRFCALLVDEIQDASPGQLALYQALARLPGMDVYFVGDTRQSIYLFRDAEPTGLRDLVRRATEEGGEVVDLVTNRRSAPLLVEAHRGLFARLEAPMRGKRWQPLEPLGAVEGDPGNAGLAVTEPPVLVVAAPSGTKDEDLDERTLRAFWERVNAARTVGGHADDTAAVLTPNWARATRARDRLRAWSGRSDAAFVEGATGRKATRVGDDVELFLSALLDDGDDARWVGVWKHPSVGLSDGALARMVAGVGLARVERAADGTESVRAPETWQWRPSRWVGVDRLEEPHADDDRRAFARAVGPLRAAHTAIGRGGTATLLDRLWSALGWRAVLAAGPGGTDEVAELEVVLDRIRDWDGEGRPPDWILAALRDDLGDRPQVHVLRASGSGPPVSCTTVFQAKGLAWDHVCVLGIGQPSARNGDRNLNRGWMRLAGRDVRLDGLRIDPRGGLSSFRDPLARLAAAVQRARTNEECARLAYVAVTRARRSVTVGLVPPPAKPDARRPIDLHHVLAEAWLAEPVPPGVAVVERHAGGPPGPRPTGWARPTGAPFATPPLPPTGWLERAPSVVGAHLAQDERGRHAARVASVVRLGNGLHVGASPVVAPEGFTHLSPTDWGEIVHGWLERWRFAGVPDRAAIADVLVHTWGAAPGEVVDWLAAISAQLREVGGPVWEKVTDPKATLLFEHPFVGVGRAGNDHAVLSGRMDLLVERKGRFTVVDFKAGARVPTGWPDLEEAAGLRTYAFQLHAYADALRGMGHGVDEVALWFVRTGTSVRWAP
jgi:ATP-dependent exoDNAse (exonuclease V) beta subunit